ncbi:TIGR01621 family pseudouridine synthase [Litoribacillus peritrichatus]|uniref:TIGR01621 family pseudouridine synthase n=1 Tax=Litoribacillus peritrichatus TaxID=718191 RepID=A0ABP7MZG7_9GAMM
MSDVTTAEDSFDVVFDHDDFVIINKSAGISVHKDDQALGLVDIVARALGYQKLYLVHRLDKMTSGLLILAKNSRSNRLLSGMFERRSVSKYYLALSDQKPKKKQGLIKGDMETSRGGNWRLVKTYTNPAITQFFSFSLTDEVSKGLRLFVLKPHTGKTHQLRVALKSIGSGVLGDERYSSSQTDEDRGYLHAWALNFVYQGNEIAVSALPKQGRWFLHPGLINKLKEIGDPALFCWPKI